MYVKCSQMYLMLEKAERVCVQTWSIQSESQTFHKWHFCHVRRQAFMLLFAQRASAKIQSKCFLSPCTLTKENRPFCSSEYTFFARAVQFPVHTQIERHYAHGYNLPLPKLNSTIWKIYKQIFLSIVYMHAAFSAIRFNLFCVQLSVIKNTSNLLPV